MKNLFFLLLLINIIYFLGQYSPAYINEAMFGTPSPHAQILLLKEASKK
ncbi:MAG: hypothetical protein KAG06_05985 [Methylococcales bacterium]|nr:hypothetical protein [Methylococcales bacterium]